MERIFLTTKILTPDCLFLFLHHDCDSWSCFGGHMDALTGIHWNTFTLLGFRNCSAFVTMFIS